MKPIYPEVLIQQHDGFANEPPLIRMSTTLRKLHTDSKWYLANMMKQMVGDFDTERRDNFISDFYKEVYTHLIVGVVHTGMISAETKEPLH